MYIQGPRGSGKTELAKHLAEFMDSTHKLLIHPSHPELEYVDAINAAVEKKYNDLVVIIDGVVPPMECHDSLAYAMQRSRENGSDWILTSTSSTLFPDAVRCNFDYIWAKWSAEENYRRSMYESLFTIIPTFEEFEIALFTATRNRGWLVLDRTLITDVKTYHECIFSFHFCRTEERNVQTPP